MKTYNLSNFVFLITMFLLISNVLAQVQSHPISQITPFDVNLNLTGVNITNVSYVFFGNGSIDTYLYRSGTNTLQTASTFIVPTLTLGWGNLTSFPSGCPAGQAVVTIGTSLTCGSAGGGWNTTSSYLFNNTGGVTVGINDSTPQSQLEIISGNKVGAVNVTAGNGSTLFYINGSSGGIGIGTTLPNASLQIVGSENITNGNLSFAGANVGLLFPDGTFQTGAPTNVSLLYGYNSTNWVGLSTTSDGILKLNITQPLIGWVLNGANLYNNTATGVGIGTASPAGLLDVNGKLTVLSSGNVGIGTTTPGATLNITSTNNAGALDIVNGTTGNHLLFVNATTGNVGIGTANPSKLLTLNAAANAALLFQNNNVNTAIFSTNDATGEIRIGSQFSTYFPTFYSGNAEAMRITSSGNVGINKTSPAAVLDVQSGIGQGSGNYAAIIGNVNTVDSTTNGVLGLTTGTAATGLSTRYVQFGAGCTPGNLNCAATIGHININNNAVNYGTSGADFGERMQVDENVTYGDIVGTLNGKTVKATTDSSLIGVVSDSTGFTGNDKDDLNKTNHPQIGLLGQVMTKVSTENSAIHKGDFITISSVAGVGAKATKNGQIIGIALENFDGTTCSVVLSSKGNCINKIPVFVNRGWYDSNSGTLEKLQQENSQLKSQLADIQSRLDKLEAGR